MPAGAFARVYRVGTRRRVGSILVRKAESGDGDSRVGVVAGRKVGHAVQRNRTKRRMREAVRRVDLALGTDYIITALDDLESQSFERLCSDIQSAVGGPELMSNRSTPEDSP